MIRELVDQAQRLFSSKSNGGKLVYKLTDRLHSYKLALLALSIVILLGYSQFRKHFECQGQGGIDGRTLTTFCWGNGTLTVNLKEPPQLEGSSRSVTHVGIQFQHNQDGKYQLLNHNYMRSLWALMIALAICSFIAQRWWASIFANDILRALLKLPGHENLSLVKRAQKLRPYEKILEMSRRRQKLIENGDSSNNNKSSSSASDSKKLHQYLVLFDTIEAITGDKNEHNHLMDFYVDQLIYLLLAMQTSAYKLSGLKLRRKLISYSICSFLMTLMQFLLPLLIIGPEYTYYGLDYAKAWLRHTLRQIINPSYMVNTVDYELSARIWPTVTSCEYHENALQGEERIIVQCTVPINEICGKLFVLIWWFVAINIVIELFSLISTIFCSLNFSIIRWAFGRKFSLRTRREADAIATFRYERAILHKKLFGGGGGNETSLVVAVDKALQVNEVKPGDEGDPLGAAVAADTINERELKQLEAEAEQQARKSSSRISLSTKKWYLWCPQDIRMFLVDKSKNIEPGKLMAKNRTAEDENGYKELREDMNIYYLMNLLYCRLRCSRKKFEQIVRMTSDALNKYLDTYRAHQMTTTEVPSVIKVDKGI